MQQRILRRDLLVILTLFILSRIILATTGLHMDQRFLYENWQYLDVETLRHNLWPGVWYDHAQPPVFNLFLGFVLKMGGSNAMSWFIGIFKAITGMNTLLLYLIGRRLVSNPLIPLFVALLYMLSPATMIFESELFYTSFITMFLMISAFSLLRMQDHAGTGALGVPGNGSNSWLDIIGFFLPLVIVSLTRSMYHLVLLAFISGVLLYLARKKPVFKRMLAGAILSLVLVSTWYVKNYVIFHQFTTSTWIGMNMARVVFLDRPEKDSSRIEAWEPFASSISCYKPFVKGDLAKRYAGLNDRDLLGEKKNDTINNLNHIDFIEISDKYKAASIAYVKAHPGSYLKNVASSAILFFGTATRYPRMESQVRYIYLYDLIYSFNFTGLVTGKTQRRITLVISAIPKLVIYFLVFLSMARNIWRQRSISLLNAFIFITIAYIFCVSSLLEHYENMRFRYEIEPLFLLLLTQAVQAILDRRSDKTALNREGGQDLPYKNR